MENTNTHGSIRVSDEVIAGIAVKAAKEVDGVLSVAPRRLNNAVRFVTAKERLVHGVGMVVNDGKLELTVHVVIRFGCRIPDVCVAVQEAVLEAVSDMTGFSVGAVHVAVVGVAQAPATRTPANQ